MSRSLDRLIGLFAGFLLASVLMMVGSAPL